MSVSSLEQIITVVSGFAVKPAYMTLAFYLAVKLRMSDATDLSLVRYSLAVFFAGELACAINYAIAESASDTLEIIHGLGMAGMWTLLPWGVYRFFDERILNFSHPRRSCALQPFCLTCHKKNEDHRCGVRRIFIFLIPALATVSLIPLTHPLSASDYIIPVFGTPTRFIATEAVQLVEVRLYPVLAAALLMTAYLLLLRKKEISTVANLFFPGFGFMSFSLFRFFFYFAFEKQPVWYNFWEEITELITVAGIGLFIWVFRNQFGVFNATTRKGA